MTISMMINDYLVCEYPNQILERNSFISVSICVPGKENRKIRTINTVKLSLKSVYDKTKPPYTDNFRRD